MNWIQMKKLSPKLSKAGHGISAKGGREVTASFVSPSIQPCVLATVFILFWRRSTVWKAKANF